MFILAVLVVTIEMNFAHHFIIVLIVIIFIIFDVLYFEPMHIRPVQWAFWDSFFKSMYRYVDKYTIYKNCDYS